MTSEVNRAERALHDRARLACAAATAAGVPGSFRAWTESGVLAVQATDPALNLLCTVSGITPDTMPAAITLLTTPAWTGNRPTLLLTDGLSPTGLSRTPDRLLAIAHLPTQSATTHPEIVKDGTFPDVLVTGYEVDGVVAAFIRAEHSLPSMRRFVLLDHGEPIAAAALTLHGDVAVLGGASTLPEHRGRGAQTRLLHHRLHIAAEAGCTLAVATARPDSVSAANLRRAGFDLHRRTAWTAP